MCILKHIIKEVLSIEHKHSIYEFNGLLQIVSEICKTHVFSIFSM